MLSHPPASSSSASASRASVASGQPRDCTRKGPVARPSTTAATRAARSAGANGRRRRAPGGTRGGPARPGGRAGWPGRRRGARRRRRRRRARLHPAVGEQQLCLVQVAVHRHDLVLDRVGGHGGDEGVETGPQVRDHHAQHRRVPGRPLQRPPHAGQPGHRGGERVQHPGEDGGTRAGRRVVEHRPHRGAGQRREDHHAVVGGVQHLGHRDGAGQQPVPGDQPRTSAGRTTLRNHRPAGAVTSTTARRPGR